MKKRSWALPIAAALALLLVAAATQINLATQVQGILGTANGGTGVATFYGSATTSNTVINPAATTDTQLYELAVPSAYFNTTNKALAVFAKIVQSTGTTQTPTVIYKIKLCTVSGCGSGTALTLLTFGASGAMTASTSESTEIYASIGTTATGSSGTLESAGYAIINTSATTALGTGGVLWNDTNSAVSSTIALTGATFLDITGQFSAQSGTKNGMVARLVTVKPVN